MLHSNRRRRGTTRNWWLSASAVQLDFVRQRYFWNGAERQQADFATLRRCSRAASGVTP